MGVTSEEQEEEEEVENENKHRSANKPNVKEACSMMWNVELYRKRSFFKLTIKSIIFRFTFRQSTLWSLNVSNADLVIVYSLII